MRTDWTEERCGLKPAVFEKLNENVYIQRRNIEELVPTDDNQDQSGYRCESRKISKDVCDSIIDQMTNPAIESLLENLQNVEIGQAEVVANTEYLAALQELNMEV
jgi:hypothetical protein